MVFFIPHARQGVSPETSGSALATLPKLKVDTNHIGHGEYEFEAASDVAAWRES